MSLKESVINHIIELEGGYVNDPSDSGGETNFGITKKVAVANGYNGDMLHMPEQVAFDIYADKYWNSVMGDDLPELVAREVVDTAVNMGVSRAGKFLQKSLNLLTDHKLIIDGSIGLKTIMVLDEYMAKRNDQETLVKMLNSLQGAFYIELAEKRTKDRKYVYGWFKNRVGYK